ncbi:hypothetical protein Mal15_31250 [Stieleria maiorica]|uniref:Uncharacterized protein n=1 Tax=Stieleria maiorica TaxID=2795974 RepID=A0A5B9MG37_9BACT|nr:hypothetical protein [Stieleria maiorica]QEF99066.1 hypothetical protein Mal15_31250 [Stieleria maiorica]
MAWKPEPGMKPSEVLDTAVDDAHAHRYDDALQEFLWFHEASRSETGMGGVRLSFALGYWMDLAEQYPPALEAFTRLRDELEQRCRDKSGDFESFHDVSAFNHYLGDDRRTIGLFMEIAGEHPDNAKRIYHVAEELLVADGMYQQCAPFLEWEQRVDTSISAYKIGLKHEESWKDSDVSPPRFARRNFETNSATIVALLSLNGRRDEAEQVRNRVLDVLDDVAFRDTLELAMSGHFPDANDGRTRR